MGAFEHLTRNRSVRDHCISIQLPTLDGPSRQDQSIAKVLCLSKNSYFRAAFLMKCDIEHGTRFKIGDMDGCSAILILVEPRLPRPVGSQREARTPTFLERQCQEAEAAQPELNVMMNLSSEDCRVLINGGCPGFPQPDRVPWTLTQEQIDSTLASIDCSQPEGKRDFAILQILKTYGVRGVGVRRLLLTDLSGERNQIRFQAVKGGKELIFPLGNDVGGQSVQLQPLRLHG